jgi:dolichol-phosphate mannosyltransferase
MESVQALDAFPAQVSLLPAPETPLVIDAAPEGAVRGRILLSLVIPTYNERDNLRELIDRLSSTLDAVLGDAYELIVVDDDSPDRTWELGAALSTAFPRLRVMRRQRERGLSTAVIRGWQAARGEVLGVLDGDLQHPPEICAALWAEAAKGADLVAGSRHTEGGGLGTWSLLRRALSSGARLLGLAVLPSVVGRLSDPMSGCFLVQRSAIAGRLFRPLGYKILLEVLARGEVREIREVGYVFEVRRGGESKVTPRVYLDYLAHLMRLRLAAPGTARFARFIAAGMSGVVVDMALLFLLSDPRALGWNLTLGKLVAAEVAILNNFLWNDRFTFRDAAQKAPRAAERLGRLMRFNAICGAGLALHIVLLHLQIELLGLDRYLANAAAIVLVAAWNYLLSVKLGWRVAPAAARPAQRDTVSSEAA